MRDEKNHISTYRSLVTVLVILLALTTISVLITGIHLGPVTVAVALLIASVKVAIVITQFMHLKFENLFLKLAVSGVFTLFVLVIVITFIDYFFR
ncbi:MAG: cytochrome C oxidase subunit IV family protein [Bacteroidales bacterium]|jgi:cytochrome c oxidase subunit 4|nr:cytochrome C oxidase subunit IV family protein [Bacteroidales bacterium]MDX9927598.1 cytochrome C oxidase subunit IV family protein [Bacteroidales bacterium]HNX82840.1 cytochrome C oxidase subunit IV family protein [Bacteroidales bacterium]HOC47684.1 cytochrome C oxidase subunit IV family protein [Bacteroidales bacterium]HPS96593.1 cytochrome C oxidase subunit IV family protein [Bacteroidales bacterium]